MIMHTHYVPPTEVIYIFDADAGLISVSICTEIGGETLLHSVVAHFKHVQYKHLVFCLSICPSVTICINPTVLSTSFRKSFFA